MLHFHKTYEQDENLSSLSQLQSIFRRYELKGNFLLYCLRDRGDAHLSLHQKTRIKEIAVTYPRETVVPQDRAFSVDPTVDGHVLYASY